MQQDQKKGTFKYSALHVLQMIIDTEVKRQGNSNVIILPRKLGFKPHDKVTVSVMPKKIATVGDIAGIFKKELKHVDTDKMLKRVKKELWGEY